MAYLMGIDLGTTGARTIIIDEKGRLGAAAFGRSRTLLTGGRGLRRVFKRHSGFPG